MLQIFVLSAHAAFLPVALNNDIKADSPVMSFPTVISDSLIRLYPGDQIRVQWWGGSRGDLLLVVDTRGKIVIPEIGILNVKGKRGDEIQDSVERMIKNRIPSVEAVQVQIVRLQPIEVFLLGSVSSPGPYKLPAGSRVFDLLERGGMDARKLIQERRSMYLPGQGTRKTFPTLRKIQVLRSDSANRGINCDLVRFVLAGEVGQNCVLYPGDRVIVNDADGFVGVSGGESGYYEYISGESITSFVRAIGVPLDTVGEFTVANGERRFSAPPSETLGSKKIDVISIPERVQIVEPNVVWVSGYVKNPGGFPLGNGMTAMDAVRLAGGALASDDSIAVISIRRRWGATQAGRNPNLEFLAQNLEQKIAISNYVNRAGGNYSNTNSLLEAGDSVQVLRSELVVLVTGAVNSPGYVQWSKHHKISDYLELAGGTTSTAWSNKIRVIDLYTNQSASSEDSPRPGSAIIVPEKRQIYFDQWVSTVATLVSAVLATVTLYTVLQQ